MSVQYTTVLGRGMRRHLERYLYDHTQIMAYAQVGDRLFAVLVTKADDDDPDAIAVPHAAYLAHYQAARLASGLYGTRVLGENAEVALREFIQDIEREGILASKGVRR